MTTPNGYILYSGPSRLDGSPVVAIVTGTKRGSANAKTGAMLQTWILPARVDPISAARTGRDAAVCGDCKHRPANLGTCYVTLFQAPFSVWTAYRRGRYPVAADLAAIGADRNVRLGSYGDPAAVPVEVWQALVSRARSHTGYSHQWLRDDAAPYAGLLMASVDSVHELEMAQSIGWRTFRVRSAVEPLEPRESVCPAAHESTVKVPLTCAQCRSCDGASGRKGSIAIVVHGAMAKRFQPTNGIA